MKKLNYLLIVFVVLFSMSCVNSLDNSNDVNKIVESGDLILTDSARTWTEKDGVICFSVISDGTNGEEWIARLESKGFRVNNYAKSVLRSKSFKTTSGVTYEVAVLKGELFSDNERITGNISKDAENRELTAPNAEVACLIREKYSDKELEAMELYWIITMHNSIKDSDGDPRLFGIFRNGRGSWLYSDYVRPDNWWDRGSGFAFVSQVSGF